LIEGGKPGSLTSADLLRPQPFDGMGEQLIGGFDESNGVGQLRVQVERSLIHPLGVNGEHNRLAERFKDSDGQTARLGASRVGNAQQLLAKLYFFTRAWFEPDDEVKGHGKVKGRAAIS
jgi:hypothetical protein